LRDGHERNECGHRGRHNAGRKFAKIMAIARGCAEAGEDTGRFGASFGRGFSFGGDGPFGADFPFGRGGGGGGPRGGGRGRRGMFGREELRLLLLSLISEEPRHGYDLIKALGERSGGHYAPSPGVIYPSLALLADEGLILEQPGADSRRRFALTAEGQQLLDAEKEQVSDLVQRLADLAEHAEKGRKPQIERAAANLAMAVGQRIAQGGEAELPHDIAAILDEAARKIERL
jgi:DNA-binding PadR family transcriptional regulator